MFFYHNIVTIRFLPPGDAVIMCCQTFVVERPPHFFISREIKLKKKNTMNPSIQTEWEVDEPEPADSPWVINTDSFSGHFDNLEGRCTFIVWVLCKRSCSIQGMRYVRENIAYFAREPDRHVYYKHTGIRIHLPLIVNHE